MESCVVSCGVYLSRNISGLPFPNRLSDFESAKSIAKGIYEIFGDEFEYVNLKSLSANKILKLLEQEEISSDLVDNKDISSFAVTLPHIWVLVSNEANIL